MEVDTKAADTIWAEHKRRLEAKNLPTSSKGVDINNLEKKARDDVEELKYKLDHPEDKDVFQE